MAELVLNFVTSLIENAKSSAGSFAYELISKAWGLENELGELDQTLTMIQGLLQDAEERQETNPAVRKWLQELGDVAYEAVDALDEYRYELLKREVQTRGEMTTQGPVRKKVRYCLERSTFSLDMANKIIKINQSLASLNSKADLVKLIRSSDQSRPTATNRQYLKTDSILDCSKLVGRHNDVLKIVNKLDKMRSQHLLSVISMVGLGGIGKTTLAKSTCEMAKEKELYDLVAWVCVSENFDEQMILGDMLEHIDGSAGRMNNIDALIKKLGKSLERKNFLLVLDDVWNEDRDKWVSFESRLSKILKISKAARISIIVTTRSVKVASMMEGLPMYKHDMQKLSDHDCWLIIKDAVLKSSTETSIPSSLEGIGQDIAKQCGGLPLVASVMGGTLGREISSGKWKKIRDDKAWMSQDENKKVLSILKISFDHLSSPLKKCFSYCSIFPKDYLIVKDDLVQLWMAQGFLFKSNESHGTMEDIGNEYFHELVCNSLFQDIAFVSDGNIRFCKMHDVVHDLALDVSRGETLVWHAGCNIEENSTVRHLRVESNGEAPPSIPPSIARRLRSLFSNFDVFCSMASNLKSLRSLKLFPGDQEVVSRGLPDMEKELPASLNKLKYLRYLDASRAHVKAPRQSFFELYNLQTFKVNSLLKLRDDVANLISLRHIYSYHPCEVSMQLDCVRSKLEASKANLTEEKLYKLKFVFPFKPAFGSHEVEEDNRNYEEVIESLEPHSNLTSLTIENYRGKELPSWFVSNVTCSGSSLLLNNLVELSLSCCNECTCIPRLGLLPSLKVLQITDMPQVRRIGDKLDVSRQSSGVGSITLFPALKELIVEDMNGLEEWVEVDEDAAARGEVEIDFPCLEKLHVAYCPELKTWPIGGFSSNHRLSDLVIQGCSNLKAIPNIDGLSSLENLDLYDCGMELTSLPLGSCISLRDLRIMELPNLISIPNMDGVSSLKTIFLRNCKELTSLPTGLGSCIFLQELFIADMPNLISIPNIDGLSSLERISLAGCDKLTSLPTGLGSCISLQQLAIDNVPNLISIPEGVGRLHSLTSLVSHRCEKLRIQEFFGCLTISLKELRVGPFCQDLEEFPLPSLNSIASLESLSLTGWDKLKSLPHQLQHLTTLKELQIFSFKGVEALPEWLGNLSSLRQLEIWNCPNLMYLPSLEAMGRLSNLKSLVVASPKLMEICANKSGPEWSKISHIPNIKIIPTIKIDDIKRGLWFC